MATSEQPSLMSSSELMELSAASPASPLASPGVTGAKTTTATCGPKLSEPFAHYNQDSHSWRTYQVSLITGTLAEYSETWPKRGTMRNGVLSERQTLAHPTAGNGSLSWPTPDANTSTYSNGFMEPNIREAAANWSTPTMRDTNHDGAKSLARYGTDEMKTSDQRLRNQVQNWSTPTIEQAKIGEGVTQRGRHTPGLAIEAQQHSPQAPETATDGHVCSPKCRRLNPLFVEMLMAFPIGWTIAPKD
jgi:hypothetical protein